MYKLLQTYHVILVMSINIFLTTERLDAKTLKARRKPEFDSLFEESGAVADLNSISLTYCFTKCFENLKCLTLFYNRKTMRCVMHSRDFIFMTPRAADTGWKFYITEDVSGRCPPPNYYYRHLDFCYTVEQAAIADFFNINDVCINKGTRLATITSQEYQDYFVHFLEGKPTYEVCLAGTVRVDGLVQLDNGTILSYYNWMLDEPYSPSVNECLVMCTGNQWHTVPCNWSWNCVSVCERK